MNTCPGHAWLWCTNAVFPVAPVTSVPWRGHSILHIACARHDTCSKCIAKRMQAVSLSGRDVRAHVFEWPAPRPACTGCTQMLRGSSDSSRKRYCVACTDVSDLARRLLRGGGGGARVMVNPTGTLTVPEFVAMAVSGILRRWSADPALAVCCSTMHD